MSIAIYNLLIHQGATFERYLKFERYLRVSKSISSTQLEIDPLPIAIAQGTQLNFAKGVVTVDADLPPGEDTLILQPYNFAIASDEEVNLGKIDFTGYDFDCTLRQDYDKDILATPTISNPSIGILKITIDYQTTATIPDNIRYVDLPKDLQIVNLTLPTAKTPPYVWQLFGKLGNFRERLAEGKALVTPDV